MIKFNFRTKPDNVLTQILAKTRKSAMKKYLKLLKGEKIKTQMGQLVFEKGNGNISYYVYKIEKSIVTFFQAVQMHPDMQSNYRMIKADLTK